MIQPSRCVEASSSVANRWRHRDRAPRLQRRGIYEMGL